MHSLVTLSLILGASAFTTVPRSTCSFTLTASGGQSGSVGQLDDGQNRIGGGLPATSFTISNGNGTVTDSTGRGCILTPSIKQFQCDLNASPASGFTINRNGTFSSSGSSTFYACPASDTEWNVYTQPIADQGKCVEIGLTASGCYTGSSTPSASPPPVSSPAPGSVPPVSVPPVSPPASVSVPPVSPPASVSVPPVSPPASVSVPPVSPPPASVPNAGSSPAAAPSVVTVTVHDCSLASSVPPGSIPPVLPPVGSPTSPAPGQSLSSPPAIVSSPPAVGSPTTAPGATSPQASTPAVGSPSAPVAPSPSSSPVGWPTTLITSIRPGTSGGPAPSVSSGSYSWSNVSTSAIVTTALPSTTTQVTAAPSGSCAATSLTGSSTSGNYQYPHLIIPVSSATPDTAVDSQYFGTVSSNTSTIFNFDIPNTYSGKTCNLVFLLPEHAQLETSSYTSSGAGQIDFKQLSGAASSSTTYNKQPSVAKDLGDFDISVGSSTLIESFSCPAGETVAYELSAVGDTYLYFFQDWNPSPLGLYITYC
ncbi:MAG: hypothetical protein M1818_006291 [Claussenomyces sp. TS43310]|nr:MAG: hypothetical protein M1818_006291 [Claussenomyces sp. TS43310]